MAANPWGQEAVTMEPLLPELITEILLTLPVKALLTFQGVSKQLSSLISGADFAKRYLQEGFSRRVLLSSCHHLRLQSLDYEALIRNRDENSALQNLQAPPEMGPNRPMHILGSCNGLVSISMGLDQTIIIWNPTLRRYRIIQDSRLTGCSYGFGYDCSTDDYKIIKVFVDKGCKPNVIEDPWVELGSVPKLEEAEYIRDYLVPLCFASNGGALMIKGGLRLFVCNLKKNTCKRIYVYDDQNEFQGVLLVESLVNPNDYGA